MTPAGYLANGSQRGKSHKIKTENLILRVNGQDLKNVYAVMERNAVLLVILPSLVCVTPLTVPSTPVSVSANVNNNAFCCAVNFLQTNN